MNTLTIKPLAKQVYQVQPEKSHPLSLSRVLYIKFLRWVEKASLEALKKFCWRATGIILLALLIAAPMFTVGYLTAIAKWNRYSVPIFIGTLYLIQRIPNAWRYLSTRKWRHRGSNQHTFHGMPVGALAQFLIENKSFKAEDAATKLGLSQSQYKKISHELEENNILVRGEKNARVLREMPYEDLLRQLREGFPMAWSEENQTWYERKGSFEQFLVKQDWQRRRIRETEEKKERKIERLDKQIEERKHSPVLASLFATETGV